MLGWAIQQGHTIAWSEKHKKYMPSIEGTPQEKWGVEGREQAHGVDK